MLVGAPIVYSIALLKNNSNPKTTRAFMEYILGQKGHSLMTGLGTIPLASR